MSTSSPRRRRPRRSRAPRVVVPLTPGVKLNLTVPAAFQLANSLVDAAETESRRQETRRAGKPAASSHGNEPSHREPSHPGAPSSSGK